MKNSIAVLLGSGVTLALMTGGSRAHHSPATHYALDETLEITGTVVDFRFMSPHIAIGVDVAKEDGSVERWLVDSRASHTVLKRRGWTESTFEPGEVITVSGSPHRKNIPQINATRIVKADGTEPGQGEEESRQRLLTAYPPDPDARGISGRWLPPGFRHPSADGPPGSPLPLTPAGLEAWANYDPERSPIVTCELMNIPTLFYADYPMDIRIMEEEVVIHHELYDVTRRVPLSSEPKLQHESGSFGVARARLEGDELVIESSDYPPSPWGLAVVSLANGNGADVPSSAEKKLVEHYSVIEDGRKLRLDFTLEDPVYLTEPFSDHWEWSRLADGAPVLYEFGCDLESAAQFTGVALERETR